MRWNWAIGLGLAAAVSGPVAGARASVDVYPTASSHVASPRTQVSFRGVAPDRLRGVTITGSRSGRHRFSVKAHSDGQGASLIPRTRFRQGELVTVRSHLDLTGAGDGVIRFRIARSPSHLPRRVYFPEPGGTPPAVQRFHSDHGLRPPRLIIRRRAGVTAPGYLFTSPKGGPGQNGPMITDGNGTLIWFRPLPDGLGAFDFRTQQLDGRPVLTWWQGRAFSPGEGDGEGIILDSQYRRIARVRAGNGFQADLHELELTPEGTALIVAYQPVVWNLRSVGGPRRGVVTDAVIQDIDIRTGLVEREWHSLDHVPPSESYFRQTRGAPYDYFHINSVDPEPGGNLLVSGRGTHTVYEISGHSGAVLWRLGGKRSSFKMGPGASFISQHDARRQPDGTISLFDNGAPPITHRKARAIVLALDAKTRTARLVRSFTHQPGFGSSNQGSVQALPDGHYLVDWGSHAWLSEYDAAGSLVLDAELEPDADDSYRAYRLPWRGTPALAPRVAASSGHGTTIVWASWNGATDVADWRVLAGDDPGALRPVQAVPRSGFETRIGVRGTPRYVQVQALSATGRVLRSSAKITPRT